MKRLWSEREQRLRVARSRARSLARRARVLRHSWYVVSVVNSIARNTRSRWFAAAVTLVPLVATVSSDRLTAMLTHGILSSLVLMLLIASSRSERATDPHDAPVPHSAGIRSRSSSTTP